MEGDEAYRCLEAHRNNPLRHKVLLSVSPTTYKTTPVTRLRKNGVPTQGHLWGDCIFQSNLWFPGKNISSRFDFFPCYLWESTSSSGTCNRQVKFINLLMNSWEEKNLMISSQKSSPKSTKIFQNEPEKKTQKEKPALHKLLFLS